MGLSGEIRGVYGTGGLHLLHLYSPHSVQILPGSLVRHSSSYSLIYHMIYFIYVT